MKQQVKPRLIYNRKQLSTLLLAGILMLFFFQVSTGSAQEGTPSPEPGTATEALFTPTDLPNAIVTETAAPVEEEAVVSSEVTQILIKISKNAGVYRVEQRLSDYGRVVVVEELEKLGIIVLEIPLDQLEDKMKEVQNISGVGNVEPNYSVHAAEVIPNDPGWSSQYGLIAIRAPQGWNISTGSTAVTIAIVDSGVDLNHADLAGKITAGYDFVNSDNIPQDDYGHGTHVAGIAAASGNNGIGVAGVSWGAKIMPVKVLDAFGGGSYANLAAGIVWAADHGAQVINMSLGGAFPSVTLQSAVLYAYNKGILIVAASGNGGTNQVFYPAHYPEVMAVGASNVTNQPASFSNYGSEVDIAAPGENIYSLQPGGYTTLSGTSMSTPFVSGLAAILFSYTSNASVVRNAMESTALDIGPAGWDLFSGAGLIQMDAALAYLVPATPTEAASENKQESIHNSNNSALLVPSLTPSSTATHQADLITATTTQTPSTLIVSFSPTPTLVQSITPTSTLMPVNRSQKWKILVSPYCLSGFLLILVGLWVWQYARRHSRRF